MSLGFSLKDFLTITNLISTISGSLKSAGGSSSDYQEIVRELDLLQRALTDIEHLTGPPSELPSINAIKCAALNCQYVLNEFAGKLQKYEKSLGNGTGESSSTEHGSASITIHQQQGGKRKRGLGKAGEQINDNLKKMEWELFMKEDVRDLRTYLTSHVGSLNMRMITQGLSTASIAAKKTEDNRTMLERKLEELREGIKTEFKAQEQILRKTNTLLDKVIDLVNDEIAPQLKEHGTCNIKILDIVKSLQTRIPDPDIRFTWFQDPCRLEDARGHRLPIPSEFGHGPVRAIIKELFKTGPGHRFVRTGDYQLSNFNNSNHLILGSEESSLTPGMNIRMAIVLTETHTRHGKVCPMPHCGSSSFIDTTGGGHTCSDCGVWFAEACKIKKTPQIQEIADSSEDEPRAKRARKPIVSYATTILDEDKERLELVAIKNIRVPESQDVKTRGPHSIFMPEDTLRAKKLKQTRPAGVTQAIRSLQKGQRAQTFDPGATLKMTTEKNAIGARFLGIVNSLPVVKNPYGHEQRDENIPIGRLHGLMSGSQQDPSAFNGLQANEEQNANSAVPRLKPSLHCSEPDCERHADGFNNEEELMCHIQEEHIAPLPKSMKYFQEQSVAILGLESHGQLQSALTSLRDLMGTVVSIFEQVQTPTIRTETASAASTSRHIDGTLESRKLGNVKKVYWQSSLGSGGLADIPQSRGNSFADIATHHGSMSSPHAGFNDCAAGSKNDNLLDDLRWRHDSRDRDYKRRQDSRERDNRRRRSRSRDRRGTSYRSRSRSRDVMRASSPPRESEQEWRIRMIKKREKEAKAYLVAQKEAREKGLLISEWTDREPEDASHWKDEDRISRSRSPPGRRGRRIRRSTSPLNIDRYVPGASRSRS